MTAARSERTAQRSKRQFDTSLYERLALSRDKEKVRELAEKGQIIESPQDLFKDPYYWNLLVCLKKPYKFTELLVRIKRLLYRLELVPETVMRGRLTLKPAPMIAPSNNGFPVCVKK